MDAGNRASRPPRGTLPKQVRPGAWHPGRKVCIFDHLRLPPHPTAPQVLRNHRHAVTMQMCGPSSSPCPLLGPWPPRRSSIPPPSFLRCSSVPPPTAGRRRNGGATEEQRRKDGGATGGLWWQPPVTAVMSATCQVRSSWQGGISAGCSCSHPAHPYDRKREVPEENSPVVASRRLLTASESMRRAGSSETWLASAAPVGATWA